METIFLVLLMTTASVGTIGFLAFFIRRVRLSHLSTAEKAMPLIFAVILGALLFSLILELV